MTTDTDRTEPTGTATYCPEDNKLRLYVGRVPRGEYLKLRADGWIATPKQREAGGCDFVATWTPSRRDTALEYAELIEDEDQTPEERAADRAERFAGYREKRTAEAIGMADRYENGPMAHGFQSASRAERSARRHDRLGAHACDAWEKAEYWQRRTAGVIAHALYKSTPAVRMGRIKELESELRRIEAQYTPQNGHELIQESRIGGAKEAHVWCGLGRAGHWVAKSDLEKIKAGYADWVSHLTLRLAYENQMMEAQGGRAAFVEMIPGGWIGKHQIQKVNKSTATGRVVSVNVLYPTSANFDRSGKAYGPDYPRPLTIHTINIERLAVDAYRAPTQEELQAFEEGKKAAKAAAPKKDPCPLINPTDEDAERLQAIQNDRAREEFEKRHGAQSRFYTFEAKKVQRVTQATYSANSKGAYARAETRGVCRNGEIENRRSNMYSRSEHERAKRIGKPVCQVRVTGFDHCGIIVITDKPQKPLPAAVWEKPFALEPETVNA